MFVGCPHDKFRAYVIHVHPAFGISGLFLGVIGIAYEVGMVCSRAVAGIENAYTHELFTHPVDSSLEIHPVFERAAETARNVMVSFAEHMAKTSVPVDMDRKWRRELTWLYAFPSGQFQTVCFPYLFPLLGFHA